MEPVAESMNMVKNIPVELLNDAFNTFRDASRKLEQQYALLELKVEELNAEIAEKNRAMERNRRLAAMGEMAAKIAHEIRNPLGSMAIFAALLERELAADPDKRGLAGHITKGVKTLDNLLSNMLLFASAPDARLSLVDIKDVIDESLVLTSGHGKANINVSRQYCGDTLLRADGGLLKQLFINLFINAFDAVSDPAGAVSVKTRLKDFNGAAAMEIEVSDNGAGIAPECIDRVFDPFFSSKERGTGLGLAIVSTVITAHKGTVNVNSAVGDGTSFVITIPLQKEYSL